MRSPQKYYEISKKILFFKNLLIFLLTLFIFCFFRNCVVQSISVWKWNICDIGLSSHRGWRKPRRLADCSTAASARWRKFCQTVWLKFDLIQFERKTQNLLQLWLVITSIKREDREIWMLKSLNISNLLPFQHKLFNKAIVDKSSLEQNQLIFASDYLLC